jgi:predicted enzyme related to lactoylglutathione lyase
MKKMDPVVHFEMPYENSGRLIKFYTQAFGWEMQKFGQEMGDYVTASTTETDANRMVKTPGNINGGFFPKKPELGQCPSVVIAVDDIKKAIKRVETQAAKSGGAFEIPASAISFIHRHRKPIVGVYCSLSCDKRRSD